MLHPFPADEMEAFEVSKDVGKVKNNSRELLNNKLRCASHTRAHASRASTSDGGAYAWFS